MLIGLAGYAGAGKDAIASEFIKIRPEFTRVAFADALKAYVCATNPRVRNLVRAFGWDAAKRSFPDVRETLQTVGMAAREHIGEDVWIRAALQTRGPVIVTDVRFPNEADAIRRRGGYVVRIRRPGVGPVNGHATETALDGYPTALTIDNAHSPRWAARLLASSLAGAERRAELARIARTGPSR